MEGKKRSAGSKQQIEQLVHLSELPSTYRCEIEKGVSTGWSSLDKFLQGIRYGEMTVITADTGVGKTTFAINLCLNACRQGIGVAINSWEMKPQIVQRKIASIVLKKPLKLAPFTDEDNILFDEWMSLHNIYINPSTSCTSIEKIEAQMIVAKQNGVQVAVFDHLDYLVNMRREKIHEAIEETVKALHEICFRLDMHFLLICHPKQTGYEKEEIGIHSLKGSSSIKQYADNIIVLHRCSRTDSQACESKVKVKVVKNRMFGTEGVTYLYYQKDWDGYLQLKDYSASTEEK